MLNSTTSKFRLRLKNPFTFDVSMKLDRTLAQRKAERYGKSKVKVTQCILAISAAHVTAMRRKTFVIL